MKNYLDGKRKTFEEIMTGQIKSPIEISKEAVILAKLSGKTVEECAEFLKVAVKCYSKNNIK